MRVLLTGGAGFSGSHIADEIARTTDWDITVLDCLTYAGKLSNLEDVPTDRLRFVYHNFIQPIDVQDLDQIDYIIHAGAETHVTNSLSDPEIFMQSNVLGTFNMLEAARKLKPRKFLYVSTDEVFGASLIPHKETDELNPSNPYSASKAAGEMLVKAYQTCFGLPCLITRTTNIFGKRQHPEKFIPMTIQKLQNSDTIEIHADKDGQIGSRQWIHASDQAAALIFLLRSEQRNDTFHIAGERKTNEEILRAVANGRQGIIHIVDAYKQYPGHDLHYALDDSKIRALGWAPKLTFEQGLALTA
jgi:dTDP-glucose 4,6-dehydratase